MKCKTCKRELTPLTGVGWIHPPTNECSENDGLIIQSKHRTAWDKTYGQPTKTYENLIKDNNLLKAEVTQWKKKTQILKEQNNQLKTQNQQQKEQLLQKKWSVRLKNILN